MSVSFLVSGVSIFTAMSLAGDYGRIASVASCFVLLASIIVSYFVLERRESAIAARVFIAAFTLRSLLALIMIAYPPSGTTAQTRGMSDVIYEDEAYYLATARMLAQNDLHGVTFETHQQRAQAYFAFVQYFCGESVLWVRLLNALIGSWVAALIYSSLSDVFGRNMRRYAVVYSVIAPGLLFWSVLYLKDIFTCFAVALIVRSLVLVGRSGASAGALSYALVGSVIAIYFRGIILFALLPALVVAGCRYRRTNGRLIISPLATAVSLGFSVGLMTLAYVFFANTAITGEQFKLRQEIAGHLSLLQDADPLSPRGLVVLTAAVMLSPILTSVSSGFPWAANFGWLSLSVAGFATGWWLLIPFLAAAVLDILYRRQLWWLAWLGGWASWIILVGQFQSGIGSDAFRYRDSLMPVTMLLAARGLVILQRRRGPLDIIKIGVVTYFCLAIVVVGAHSVAIMGR